MPNLQLQVTKREQTGKTATRQLKESGLIPMVMYGHNVPTQHLAVPYIEFEKALRQAGESTLLDIAVAGQPSVKALIHEVAIDPVSRRYEHVDLHQVKMDEKLHATIKLHFTGEAPAVKEQGGVLVTNLHEFEVECLPTDLVDSFSVDISSLKTFDDVIKVKDVAVSSDIHVLNRADDVVALVQPPRSEQELAGLEAKPEQVLPEGAAETPKAEEAGKVEAKTPAKEPSKTPAKEPAKE